VQKEFMTYTVYPRGLAGFALFDCVPQFIDGDVALQFGAGVRWQDRTNHAYESLEGLGVRVFPGVFGVHVGGETVHHVSLSGQGGAIIILNTLNEPRLLAGPLS
jgi:hypothetical protein